jgi:hypothetical protein
MFLVIFNAAILPGDRNQDSGRAHTHAHANGSAKRTEHAAVPPMPQASSVSASTSVVSNLRSRKNQSYSASANAAFVETTIIQVFFSFLGSAINSYYNYFHNINFCVRAHKFSGSNIHILYMFVFARVHYFIQHEQVPLGLTAPASERSPAGNLDHQITIAMSALSSRSIVEERMQHAQVQRHPTEEEVEDFRGSYICMRACFQPRKY